MFAGSDLGQLGAGGETRAPAITLIRFAFQSLRPMGSLIYIHPLPSNIGSTQHNDDSAMILRRLRLKQCSQHNASTMKRIR
jgi:hypothetical protein